jgi:lysophospholipase L1-like esterase
MKEKYGATVVNNACSGTNVGFIMNNFNALVDADDDIIICTIGTNNRHKNFCDGDKPTKEEFLQDFYNQIKDMYGMFKETGIPTVFVANIPASDVNEHDGPHYWRILHMSDINYSYKRLAKECGATVLSLYDLFSDYCREKNIKVDELLGDYLHPNDKGYKVMFDLLVKELEI